MKRLSIAVLCALSSACTYQVTPEGQQALASMTDDQAVQTIKKALTNQEDSGLGMCSLPHFNRDTRTPRFESADTEKFTYLDNKGGGDCTNDCPDPNHQFTVPYPKVKRIFVSRTQTPSTCRSGPGLDVIQIIGWHEKRNLVMVTVPSQDLPRILAAFKHLNPRIALKNAY